MGSTPSKAARKLSREKPSQWAGTRVQPSVEPARQRPPKPLAFDTRNDAIERDAKDPQFMQKLGQLGQVRVDHHMQTVRAAGDTQDMYRSRRRSEAEASSPPESIQNRLLVASLTELLDGRRSVTSSAELEALAKRYHVDVAKVQQLGRVVNTPSIDERTVVRTTDKHGEESLTMMARWVDPVFSRE